MKSSHRNAGTLLAHPLRGRYDLLVEKFKQTVFAIVGIIMLAALILGPARVEQFLRDRSLGKPPPQLFGDTKPQTQRPVKPASDPQSSTAPQAPQSSTPTAHAHVGQINADRVSATRISRARTQLSGLAAATSMSMAGYDRDLFHHWSDLDGNGCDQRADTLSRDALQITRTTKDGCRPVNGEWVDPYGGTTIRLSTKLDIDHVIPLAAAWRLGASAWSAERREKFANDPGNLLAVEASLNRQKGDKLADAWRPPRKQFWCAYAVRSIDVHARYDLPASASESRALGQLLSTC
jgi:hypothetical protein